MEWPAHLPIVGGGGVTMQVKIRFSQQKFFVLENLLLSFGKNIGLPSEANCWITLRNSHGPHPK